MPRTRSTTLIQSCAALFAVAALTACSPGATTAPADDSAAPAESTTSSPAADNPASSVSQFCAEYSDAGGTLATPGLFQVGLPADSTIADLSQRLQILELATPPEDIAEQWNTLEGLYSEVITLAENTPDNGPVVEPRIFDIVDEINAPASDIRDFLDANC